MTDPRNPANLPETAAGTSPAPEGTPADTSGSHAVPLLPTKGPRYGERKLLGRGGMGEVHLQRDEWLGRDVAVKTLSSDRSSLGVARTRFLREARVQGQLEHPAIVPVYDVGVDEHAQEYFTMKRVTGRTLQDVLAAGDFPQSRLLGILRQVCLAVDYAHSRSVVHRDLKPANVMIGDFGEVYVLDWGLARVQGLSSSIDERARGRGETLSGQMMGTPGYMAPEQIESAHDADERADVYSLGAILFEVLVGKALHEGRSVGDLVRSTKTEPCARPSTRAPDLDVPPELDALTERATARDPALRTASARQLAEAIESYLEGDRDLAARRALAKKHAEAADVAAREAFTAGPDAIAARAKALEEVGRALTLDPENTAGASTLIELIARPPAVLPDEVKSEIERSDREAMKMRNRKGAGLFVGFLLFMLLLPALGMESLGRMAIVLVPLAVALLLTLHVLRSPDLSADRFEKWTDGVVALALLAVGFISGVMTSNIVVPVLALAFVMGAAGAARPARRMRYLWMGLAAFAVPFVIEWLHLMPSVLPGMSFVGGTACVVATGVRPDFASRMLLFAATAASLVTPAFTVFPVLDAAAALRTQSLLQAWQLRQLAPTGPLRAAGEGGPG